MCSFMDNARLDDLVATLRTHAKQQA